MILGFWNTTALTPPEEIGVPKPLRGVAARCLATLVTSGSTAQHASLARKSGRDDAKAHVVRATAPKGGDTVRGLAGDTRHHMLIRIKAAGDVG